MLIACHLFFGLSAGILLQERYRDQRIILACLLGSLLPDIIDKPLGFLIFPEIGDGRLIAHALAGLCIIAIISLILLKERILVVALCTGVFTHQLLDEMWKIPVNWFYPVLGDFPIYVQKDYFAVGLMRELTTPSEWAFALSILVLGWMWQSGSKGSRFRIAAMSGIPALLLLVTGR